MKYPTKGSRIIRGVVCLALLTVALSCEMKGPIEIISVIRRDRTVMVDPLALRSMVIVGLRIDRPIADLRNKYIMGRLNVNQELVSEAHTWKLNSHERYRKL